MCGPKRVFGTIGITVGRLVIIGETTDIIISYLTGRGPEFCKSKDVVLRNEFLICQNPTN
ncbi:hypothetical protein SDC9_173678 [bioreactor metagenome]|uniref:Uncharacterized protein n=1 Tax=bioreactor metagenome TaxID=1076179 RepID=A0A645GQL4_9ZZZZ